MPDVVLHEFDLRDQGNSFDETKKQIVSAPRIEMKGYIS